MIHVTKTYLPPKEKYLKYVDKIYTSGWVTNNGPLVQELERRLADFLGVKHIVLVANGTIALEIAYKALELEGEVITTPFSFVATTSSLVANGLEPVYVDINPKTFNIDESLISSRVSTRTSAIVPVHVFGNACEVEDIARIAQEYNLKVVYDAAHAFNIHYKGESLLKYGDISTLSFHATKLFHTIEGGALVINDDTLVEKVRYLINFGIAGEEKIPHLGINGKMNEFEAAMGLCILDDIEKIQARRKSIAKHYQEGLDGIVEFQVQNPLATANYSYFPVLFDTETTLKNVQRKLNDASIYPRRYFYPSLDTLSYVHVPEPMSISRSISKRILCLPIYESLEKNVVKKVIDIIRESIL